jgi:PKD repeat protein
MKNCLIISLFFILSFNLKAQNCNALFSYSIDSANVAVFADLSTAQSGTIISWFWNFGDGTSSYLQNVTHQFSPVGNASYVCLTIITNDSCTATFCDSVFFNTINPCDSFNISYSVVNTSGPAQNDGAITTQVSGGMPPYIYLWSNNDSTSDISNLIIGLYCVTVIDAEGCAVNQCMDVFVDTSLNNCNASFNILPAYCPNCYGFFDNSTASGNIISWTWNFGDGNISTLQNAEHTFLDSGMYNVCLIIMTDQGCTDTICDSVFAQYNLITYSISGDVTANEILLSNGTAELYDTNLDESHPPLYSQNIVNGVYAFPDVVAGTYKLLAIPDPPASQNFAATFFGNTIEYNDAYVLSVYFDLISVDIDLQPKSNGINDQSENICSIYPNPFEENLFVSMYSKHKGTVVINIHNAIGQLVFTQDKSVMTGNNIIELYLINLKKGIYFIHISDDNNFVLKGKIIKE